jgi:hypothetical protein
MPKIEVKRARASATISDREPHWIVDVDYGAFEVQIPIPAHYLAADDFQTQRRQASHPDTIKLRNSPDAGPGSAGCHRRPACLCFCGATIATVDEHIGSAHRGVGA